MDGHDLLKQLGADYDKNDACWYNTAKFIFGVYENMKKVGFNENQAFELAKIMFASIQKK